MSQHAEDGGQPPESLDQFQNSHSVLVLLPSHSYSLAINSLHAGATIGDLKHAISDQCPGRPSPSGQRIIVQGRVLKDEDSLADFRTVHLAVHPAAWQGTPPSSPSRTTIGLPSIPASSIPLTPMAQPPPSSEPPLPLTLQLSSLPTEFITHVHANALRVLSGQPTIPWPGPSELSHARRVCKTVIKYAGLGWPPVLDQEIPPSPDINDGLQYSYVVVDNLPYLALANKDATPTVAQRTVLQILTYTFPLLPLMKHLPRPAPVSSRGRTTTTAAQVQAQAQAQNIQNAVRRFGIQVQFRRGGIPGRVPNPGAAGAPPVEGDEDPRAYFPPVPEFRFQFHFHLPPSRVLLQLFFTLTRAALLMYFFAPARKPMWIACIVGWIGWEIFVVLRGPNVPRRAGAAAGGVGAGAVAGAPAANNQANPDPANVAGGGVAGGNNVVALRNGAPGMVAGDAVVNRGPNPPDTLVPAANINDITRIIDRLAFMNLASESDALNLVVLRTPTTTAPAPGANVNPADPTANPQLPAAAVQADVQAAVEHSLVHRVTTFLALFITSLIPAIWERRRTKLRDRERWVRDQFIMGAGGAPPRSDSSAAAAGGGSNGQTLGSGNEEGSAEVPQPTLLSAPELARRRREALGLAGWRKDYVDRVIAGEAGDGDDL